jgi:chromosome segregation ATPase
MNGIDERVQEMKAAALFAVLTVWFVVACQKSPEKQAEELSETQKTAAANADKARREADEKAAKAQHEADEQVQKEQKKVDEKVGEIARDADVARADARKKLEEDLGKVDKRLIDLRTKLATAKTTKMPRSYLEESLRNLQAKSEAVKSSIPEIQTASPVALGSVRTTLQSRITEIEKSLDDLERKV